jgi:uncharacterized protein
MTSSARAFRLNVGFIVHEEIGFSHEFVFELGSVEFGAELSLRDFRGTAHMMRTPQGLLLKGVWAGRTTLECARCLKDFDERLHWTITELFAFNEKSVAEPGMIVPEDAQIDLYPLIREYALLEIPIRPICRPDCKGLCPVCGEDLNIRDCGHRPHADDSPFVLLKKLL